MATKKELVAAQAFSRRRLLTAFVSGTPGGRELEPTKPMRAVVAGVALSVLLVLGSMGFGLIKPGLPNGWDDGSLVLTKDSGTRFVAIKGTLYPVANTTSARLVIPSASFSVVEVSQDKISEVPRGERIGITGAPDELPAPENLRPEGWLTCASPEGGTRTTIGPGTSGGRLVTDSAVVRVAEQTFVVHGPTRHLVPDDSVAAVLRALDLETAPVRQAPATWLNVLAAGTELAPLVVPGAGTVVPVSGLPSSTVVGSVVEVTGSGTPPDRYLVTADARLAPLSEVAYRLYQLGSGSGVGEPIVVTSADIAPLDTAPSAAPADWPAEPSPSLDEDAPLCALLTDDGGDQPTGQLASAPPEAVPAGSVSEVSVSPGHGSLLRATGDQVVDRGPVQLVDQSGTVFAVPGADTEVLARLGYEESDVAPIPQAWTALLPAGPELTAEAASATPVAVP